MNSKVAVWIRRSAVIIVAAIGVAAVFYWQGVLATPSPALRLPTLVALTETEFDPASFPGEFHAGIGVAGKGYKENWPCFRGENRDGICQESPPLLNSFPESGPPIVWRMDCYDGYAGVAIKDGRAYLLDYDDQFGGDVLRCLSMDDGSEIWSRSYKIAVRHDHGKTRTVPAVDDKYVVTIGPRGQVMCCLADSGDFVWGIDMVSTFGTKIPEWHNGQCPLIDNGMAILAPAGKDALLVAVDCASGKIRWRAPNPKNWKMTHSSILPMVFDGVAMYVYSASDGVVGVSANDGTILWEYPWKVTMANVPMPIDCGDGKLFLTGGYGAGSKMIQLGYDGDKMVATEKFKLSPAVFSSDQQTPIFYKGCIYGVMSKDTGQLSRQMICLDVDGKVAWSSGKENLFGPVGGPYMVADGKLLVLDDHGVLAVMDASSQGYRQLARYDFFPDAVEMTADGKGMKNVSLGHEAWAPMAISDGRLVLRDSGTLICVDLRANGEDKRENGE